MRCASLVVPFTLLLALTGCAQPAPTAVTRSKTSASQAPTVVSPGNAAKTTCTDIDHDGGSFDIARVDVTRSDGDFVAVKVKVKKLPRIPNQAASLVLTAYDSTGNHGGIFSTDWLGGGKSALVSVFDDTTMQNSYVSTTPTVNSQTKTITTDFPSALFDRMGKAWVWKLVTTLGDSDEDSCSTIPAGLG